MCFNYFVLFIFDMKFNNLIKMISKVLINKRENKKSKSDETISKIIIRANSVKLY